MTRRKIPKSQPGGTSHDDKLLLAVTEYKRVWDMKGDASFRGISARYGVHWETLRNRVIRGQGTREEYGKLRQRLTPAEEKVLWEYCKQLEAWGAPGRVCQLRKMAEELLQEKGEDLDRNPLGKNWPTSFLTRHSDLKSMFTNPQDKNRWFSEEYDTFKHFFDLYSRTVNTYLIEPEDQYNMDEKGAMMGVIGHQRCIVSKSNKKPKVAQDGNREWVTLVECVSMIGTVLSPWIIFKGKVQPAKWMAKMKELRKDEEFVGHICISDNGWTDNELGVEWLKRCFEPETAKRQKGKWRLLLWDGHSSHISTAAIRFCLAHDIIPLCLPPHTTHLLQPADVGLFGPEATLYKNAIQRRSRPGAAHKIDKIDFLEVYHEIRPKALCQSNIKHAWRDVGLFPFDPDVVLSKLKPPEPPTKLASNSRPSTAQGPAPTTQITTPELLNSLRPTVTPYDQAGVKAIIDKAKQGIIHHLQALEKLGKAVEYALAKNTVISNQNEDFVNQAKEAQKKKHQLTGDLGKARVIGGLEGLQALENRETKLINRIWQSEGGLGRIKDDIFTWEITSQRSQSSRRNQSSFRSPIRSSVQVSPLPILPPLRMPTFSRSIPIPSTQALKERRQTKIMVRKAIAQVQVQAQVQETVVVTRSGRIVKPKKRDL
jgi:hypothetical protein